jgi:hypothetical protein
MKITAFVFGALFAAQASAVAVSRDDDYSKLNELVKQAEAVAREQLASTEAKRAPGSCTLNNLSIRREW